MLGGRRQPIVAAHVLRIWRPKMYQQILVMICLVLIRTKYHLLNIQKPIPLPVTDMSKNLDDDDCFYYFQK